MSPLQLAVDVLALVTKYLKDQADVDALVHKHVSPTGSTGAADEVTLGLAGGPLANTPFWLEHPRVQFSCWGHDEPTANLIARTVRAAVITLAPGRYSGGIVTGVTDVELPRWLPDAVPTPARPRYLFTAVLHVHPLPA